MHIIVLGTGIVGACTAAWLQRDGHRITFVSPLPPGQACSFGNAGSLSPSACLPVGMPGMWKQVPGWLRDPDGPLRIRPRYLHKVLPWMLRFLRASSREEVVRIAGALRGLLAPIFDSYDPLLAHANAQHLVRRTGCLYVYGSDASAARWKWGMDLRRNLGVELQEVSGAQLQALEPDLAERFGYALLAPDNGSTTDPEALVKALHAQCVADGADDIAGFALGFEQQGDRVTAVRLGASGDYVYVLNAAERTVSLRPVRRGPATVEKIVISSGLQAGERVITEGADRLKDGARVVLPGDAPGAGAARQGRRPQGAASAPRGSDAGAPAPRRGASAAPPAALAPSPATPVAVATPSPTPDTASPAPAAAGAAPTPEQRQRFLDQVKDEPEDLARRKALLAKIDQGDAAALARWQKIRERRRQGSAAPAQ